MRLLIPPLYCGMPRTRIILTFPDNAGIPRERMLGFKGFKDFQGGAQGTSLGLGMRRGLGMMDSRYLAVGFEAGNWQHILIHRHP